MRAFLIMLVLASGCSSDQDLSCSGTCIGKGVAISADACSDELLKWPSCKAPPIVREPIVGELVEVVSDEETRSTLVLSVSSESFAVGGPPSSAELGSAVIGSTDGALLGIVQEYSSTISICSVVR